jgi:hypothetical protein
MAVFNEILVGRFNRALQKLTGIKGGPPSRQLGSEIMPTFCFPWGNELRYLEGWAMHTWATVLAASPANLNAAMLRNPVGSGVVAVFHKLVCSNNGAANDSFILSQGPRTTDLPTPVTLPAPSVFDLRFGSSALIASTQQAAGPGTAPPDRLFISNVIASSSDIIIDAADEIPLLPGGAISFRNQLVNNATSFAFWWRERMLEESELF